jgi:hypothetical protein
MALPEGFEIAREVTLINQARLQADGFRADPIRSQEPTHRMIPKSLPGYVLRVAGVNGQEENEFRAKMLQNNTQVVDIKGNIDPK